MQTLLATEGKKLLVVPGNIKIKRFLIFSEEAACGGGSKIRNMIAVLVQLKVKIY